MPVLLNLCFFARRKDFSCGLPKLIQLMKAGAGSGENCEDDGSACIGHLISMRLVDLFDQSVETQHA